MLVTGVSCVPPPRARRTRTVAVPGAAAPPRRGPAGAARAARARPRIFAPHTKAHTQRRGSGAPGGGGQAPSTLLIGLGLISQSVKTYTLVSLTQLITHTVSISEAVACLYTSNEESGSWQLPGIAD
jgi:hypothetical protein